MQIVTQKGKITYGNLINAIVESDSAKRESVTPQQADIVLQVFAQCVLKACENDVTVVVKILEADLELRGLRFSLKISPELKATGIINWDCRTQ